MCWPKPTICNILYFTTYGDRSKQVFKAFWKFGSGSFNPSTCSVADWHCRENLTGALLVEIYENLTEQLKHFSLSTGWKTCTFSPKCSLETSWGTRKRIDLSGNFASHNELNGDSSSWYLSLFGCHYQYCLVNQVQIFRVPFKSISDGVCMLFFSLWIYGPEQSGN